MLLALVACGGATPARPDGGAAPTGDSRAVYAAVKTAEARPAAGAAPGSVETPDHGAVSAQRQATAVALMGAASLEGQRGDWGSALDDVSQALAVWPAYPDGASLLARTRAVATAQAIGSPSPAAAQPAQSAQPQDTPTP
jgi:hypothetical protein